MGGTSSASFDANLFASCPFPHFHQTSAPMTAPHSRPFPAANPQTLGKEQSLHRVSSTPNAMTTMPIGPGECFWDACVIDVTDAVRCDDGIGRGSGIAFSSSFAQISFARQFLTGPILYSHFSRRGRRGRLLLENYVTGASFYHSSFMLAAELQRAAVAATGRAVRHGSRLVRFRVNGFDVTTSEDTTRCFPDSYLGWLVTNCEEEVVTGRPICIKTSPFYFSKLVRRLR